MTNYMKINRFSILETSGFQPAENCNSLGVAVSVCKRHTTRNTPIPDQSVGGNLGEKGILSQKASAIVLTFSPTDPIPRIEKLIKKLEIGDNKC